MNDKQFLQRIKVGTQKNNPTVKVKDPNKKVVEVSGYNLDKAQTDSRPWEGAYGDDLRKDLAAKNPVVASRDLPKGVKVKVDNTTYTVKDKMNKRYEGTGNLDILFPTKKQALQWGRKKKEVEILPPKLVTKKLDKSTTKLAVKK